MALTALEIKNAKPKNKPYRLFDGGGLYLEITKKGQKYWRLKYRFQNKEKRFAIGVFPAVGLKEAREARDSAKQLLSNGIDPSADKKSRKQKEIHQKAHSFAAISHEWHLKNFHDKNPGYAKRVWRALEKDLFPAFGDVPIGMITGPMMRDAILRIEERDAVESAHRTLQNAARIYGYANAMGYTEIDPTRGIKGALSNPKSKHFASFHEPKKIGQLLRAIDGYDSPVTRAALQLAIYTFVRPGELRKAEWSEFNLDEGIWKIPEHKMKMRKPHIVPLSTQVIDVITSIQPITSNSIYLFPSVRSNKSPMSEGTINAALRRMGYSKEEITGHGFRHIASTLLNEQAKWNPDAIERQLAHTDRSKIRATYDHSKHLSERIKMMQSWADYLDSLSSPGKVLTLDIPKEQA